MFKKVLIYTAVLVGTYLALSKATAAGQLISSAGGTYDNAVKVLQGR